MQIFTDISQRIPEPAVLTIGSFDGVHLGHQHLIGSAVQRARDLGVSAVALTFDPSPREVLRPDLPVSYLTHLAEKLRLLAQAGVDQTVVVPFTRELANVEAPDFIAWVREYVPFVELWEGEGFALGHGRTGNLEVLARLGEEMGYTLRVANLVEAGGEPVSSTRIRQALASGDIDTATALLGRYPTVPGVVVHGSKRGRELGYPTANLALQPNQALPADGVYATWTTRQGMGHLMPSVTSVGIRPTFENSGRLVEIYILDFSGDLYGEKLTAHFVKFLRSQIRFDNIQALIEQMRADEAETRRVLGVDEGRR
jgi:riboflavin kinase/FMN adenylyltransferase